MGPQALREIISFKDLTGCVIACFLHARPNNLPTQYPTETQKPPKYVTQASLTHPIKPHKQIPKAPPKLPQTCHQLKHFYFNEKYLCAIDFVLGFMQCLLKCVCVQLYVVSCFF